MKNLILNQLKQIEIENKIEILFSVESGSRAWGFPSPDSDYDVRFIYKRKCSDYLKISETNDFIEPEITDVLDIKGWDIQKVLRLMIKSNASINEYLQSPIHYITNEKFENELFELVKSQFNPQKVAAHYLGITIKRLIEIENTENMQLKSLFYALRSVLSALFIHEHNTIPPMNFNQLKDLINDESIQFKVEQLQQLKSTVDESFTIEKDEALINWIKELHKKIKTNNPQLPSSTLDLESIDHFFIKTIQ